jgi:hypothetical protein
MFVATKPHTIDEYLAGLSPENRAALQKVRRTFGRPRMGGVVLDDQAEIEAQLLDDVEAEHPELQRRQGRDLFDLHQGLRQLSLDPAKVIAAFHHYLAHEGMQISRANAEERMLDKLTRSLTDDIAPMLAADIVYRDDDALEAFERVWFRLIVGLNGEAWHKSEAVIDEFRATSLPNLLLSARA